MLLLILSFYKIIGVILPLLSWNMYSMTLISLIYINGIVFYTLAIFKDQIKAIFIEEETGGKITFYDKDPAKKTVYNIDSIFKNLDIDEFTKLMKDMVDVDGDVDGDVESEEETETESKNVIDEEEISHENKEEEITKKIQSISGIFGKFLANISSNKKLNLNIEEKKAFIDEVSSLHNILSSNKESNMMIDNAKKLFYNYIEKNDKSKKEKL